MAFRSEAPWKQHLAVGGIGFCVFKLGTAWLTYEFSALALQLRNLVDEVWSGVHQLGTCIQMQRGAAAQSPNRTCCHRIRHMQYLSLSAEFEQKT